LYHNKFFSNFFLGENVSTLANENMDSYDAFISYAEEDSNFVQQMIKILESPSLPEHKTLNKDQLGGRTYRFCIHERDWEVGPMILDNIRSSVKQSFRTIILLSKKFAESEWCQHEFDEAYKEKKIIVVMMEGTDISDFNGNGIIQSYLTTYTYLKQEDPKIWKKLSYQLPHKRSLFRSLSL
jgi:hypothetical protein